MHGEVLASLAAILTVGMACQWVAWRLKLPAILFLLLSGIVAGPVLGVFEPDPLFGDLLFPFISLAVAVILFEGSLTLKFREIPGLEKVIRNLITGGVLITWLVTAITTRWLLGFSWEIAMLFGAIMVVTGPTVIVPMLRTIRPKERVANTLRWEGILIDPIGATLAILVYQFILSEGTQGGVISGAVVFGKILLIGCVLGAFAGYLLAVILRRHWVPRYLHNYLALALVCGVFAISDMLQAESGLLTVTVMGVLLANLKGIDLEGILDFKENLSVLLISTLFIVLAARMDADAFLSLGWGALAVFGVIQLVSRPLSVYASSWGSKLTLPERHLLAWIAPRGIVAAAISALFAIKLDAVGYEQAHQLVPLTFMVIIGTVLLQSVTAGPLARGLKVAQPEPEGFLIVGANRVAQTLGKALKDNDIRVVLADDNWSCVKEAEMRGLAAYWGNPASEHAERHLDLAGIGHLMAMSEDLELNALVAHYYRQEFEPNRIFTIRNRLTKSGEQRKKSKFRYGGQHLFGDKVSYTGLKKSLQEKAEIHTTELTEEFDFEQLLKDSDADVLPLFAIDEKESVHVFTSERQLTPAKGWKIISLKQPRAKTEPESEKAE
ncbi:K(+)/H(+) antiporter NhaP2 [Saliniradius amylolyticus]|uniref:K(+)/H(+) antiporter NhaP2 n=1 Tax=Saliniradius amylolyticus TaxID=2183582 RepID=A0A2S2E205_9ALTE|nr:sodium:proton antiporter [Saliniradius amylolyticus]AWL11552.1 K(+)/H(+) antiporter NhaP2 [Saliniradius amylolyticus]